MSRSTLRDGLLALLQRLAERLLGQRTGWRWAGHAAAWPLLMVAATFGLNLGGLREQIDWRLTEALIGEPERWPPHVALLDLGWNLDPATLPAFRARLARALQALAQSPQPPRMVVLDVTLSTLQEGLVPLADAVAAVRRTGTPLFAAFDLGEVPEGLDSLTARRRQGNGPELYAGGATLAHTELNYRGPLYWYRPCAGLPWWRSSDCRPAMASAVGARWRAESVPRAPQAPLLFRPGQAALAQAAVWRLGDDGHLQPPAGNGAAELRGQVLVVGNLDSDRLNGRSGPELLGWAIGEQIEAVSPAERRPQLLAEPGWALAATLLFGPLTAGLFVLLNRQVRALHLRLAATALASVAGAVAVLALGVLGLHAALGAVYPQVAIVGVGIVLAAGLAWHATHAAVRDRALYTWVAGEPEAAEADWDVFISYSHSPPGNIERVRREIVEPLQRCSTTDGPLRIFFDQDSIRVGTQWYVKLADGIERSRCFVAVYSADYFRKNFCLFELRKAVVRDIAGPRERFRVLPLQLEPVPVPAEFAHLQWGSPRMPADTLKDVMDALRAMGRPVL